ncbi:MAG: S-adenosyl-l-methionine hydroxide adenosyltransferase family protein [Candidatus Bathyarchaeota archaeon]|nr:MAG: S-adenosyl-l-methionine hydroxide adenosyltransferase family protein [Candidatus Bathyarchaeota archaeon]
MPVITLLTDYGIKDSYVAEVKGAILKILPEATIVDISHDVGNYSIDEGAFHIARSVPYFPEGTVHVGVVDPTVGSDRKAIIIKAKGAYLVGPDNGLLAPAAERLGFEKVYEIENRDLLPEKVSDVFDGRDTFGPTGALLAKGVPPETLGSELDEYVRLPAFEPKLEGDSFEATVIHVDGFGNLVTNVTYDHLGMLGVGDASRFRVEVGGREYLLPYVRRFSAVPEGELLLLVAGGGYMEFAVNQGNAEERLGIGKGAKALIKMEK